MSKSKAPVPVPRKPDKENAEPSCVMIGDRFEKRGRRVIDWRVNDIANPPHGSPIVTFVEIDGTARLRLRVTDIYDMGFQRVGESRPSQLSYL